MQNQVKTLLAQGLQPVVRINSRLRAAYDWDGYLTAGMLARIESLRPAPGWVSGAQELTFQVLEFAEHNKLFQDGVSDAVREEPSCWASACAGERILLLEGSDCSFFTLESKMS